MWWLVTSLVRLLSLPTLPLDCLQAYDWLTTFIACSTPQLSFLYLVGLLPLIGVKTSGIIFIPSIIPSPLIMLISKKKQTKPWTPLLLVKINDRVVKWIYCYNYIAWHVGTKNPVIVPWFHLVADDIAAKSYACCWGLPLVAVFLWALCSQYLFFRAVISFVVESLFNFSEFQFIDLLLIYF